MKIITLLLAVLMLCSCATTDTSRVKYLEARISYLESRVQHQEAVVNQGQAISSILAKEIQKLNAELKKVQTDIGQRKI